MLSATANGSPPPTFATRLGTAGRNTGSTTPTVLLQLEMSPVTNATTPFTVAGVASVASIDGKSSIPPVRPRSQRRTVTPHTLTITPRGTCRTAAVAPDVPPTHG